MDIDLTGELSAQSPTLVDLELRPDVDLLFQDLNKCVVSSESHAVTVLYN